MEKKFSLSQNQDNAANPSENVWVQANAGTGKTSVLVQRLLRIFFRNDDISDCGILCLTYTKAAAGEMRNRILKALLEWAKASDTELIELLKDVSINKPATFDDLARARRIFFTYIDNPDLLKIKTIHSFCEEILHQFPIEAGISPSWSLISEDVQRILLRDAFSRLINTSNNARINEAFSYLVDRIDENKLDDLLKTLSDGYKLFFQINDFVKYREYFIDTIKEFLELNTPVQTEFSREKLEKIIYIASEELKKPKSPAATLTKIITNTKQYIENSINFDEYKKVYLTQKGLPDKNITRRDFLVEEQTRVYMVDQYNLTKRTFDDSVAMLDLSSEFAKIYGTIKQQHNLLDFDDLILYTKKLFSNPETMGWVLSQLNVKLTHILLDEAQDTSPIQWDILRMLSGDFFTEGDTDKNPHSLFVVGDTKQSIYGFQGADPRAFDFSREEIKHQIEQNMREIREIPLDQSYRSMPQILYTVDTFFNDETVKLRTGFINNSHKWAKKEPGSFVELYRLLDAGKEDVTLQDYITMIADKIKSVLEEGVFIPDDIMVLVQNREPMAPKLVKELKHRNIPVAGSDRIKLPDFPAIRDLLNIVRFCINNGDDYSLCCVLKSPVFRLTEQEIFNICKIKNEDNKQKKQEQPTAAPTTVFSVLEKEYPETHKRLTQIIDWSENLAPYSFFTNILNSDKTRQSMIAALGEQIIDPLEEFMTICLAYERTQSGTLRDFLKWFITGGSTIKRDMDTAPGVRIVTIHGSKGLEARVIFLIDTVRPPKPEKIFPITPEMQSAALRARGKDMPIPWLWSPRQDNGNGRRRASEVRAKVQIAEHYRLLYVAMTRAINRLYIYGFAANRRPATELSWHTQLWRVLSNAPKATVSDEIIRIQDVE